MIWALVGLVAVVLFAGVGLAAANTPGGQFLQIQQMIRNTANRAGVDPAVMLALSRQESSFDPGASNPADPSYGLFGIKPTPWLAYFGHSSNTAQLFNAQFNATLACQIVSYFQGRGFVFPEQADIYNVGETLWHSGRRNVAYRDRIKSFYRLYNV